MIASQRLALSLVYLVALTSTDPSYASSRDALDRLSGPELVALADDLRDAARAQDNPRLEALAQLLLMRARNRTFAIDGRSADLGRSLHDEALTAAAAYDPQVARLVPQVIPPDRGREGGPLRQTVHVEPTSGWRTTARFRRNEPTYLYVRAPHSAALHVIVKDPTGQRVCDTEKQNGRVLCAWTPTQSGESRLWVRTLNGEAASIEVLVN